MFDSIKHWFDTLEQQGRLFDHPEDHGLRAALASVLFHVISADNHLDARKKHEFKRILKQELQLDDDTAEHLYQAARGSSGDLHADLHTVNFYLKPRPLVRLEFMRKLLQLIDVEGTDPRELEVFFEALHEVFPEVKDLRDEEI
jgi:uncharacterized tellurite resistance protein B-like protein